MPPVRKKHLIRYMARRMFEITINKSTLMAQAAALYFKSKKKTKLCRRHQGNIPAKCEAMQVSGFREG